MRVNIILQRKHFAKRNLECSICIAPQKNLKKKIDRQPDCVMQFPSWRETDVCNLSHITEIQ